MIKTYDPKKVTIIVNGIPITGYADGTFIGISGANDEWAKGNGADGEVTRSKSNDLTSQVTLTLLQVSSGNDVLSALLALDRAGNIGVFTLSIVDKNGTTNHFWPDAWILKKPDEEFAKEVGERAWVIDTGQPAVEFIGGNTAQSGGP